MTDRNLLFQAPMIRALIAGTKTQTRRILDAACDEPPAIAFGGAMVISFDENGEPRQWPRTAAAGDRIWVREAWRASYDHDLIPPREIPPGSVVDYLADDKLRAREVSGKSRPSMFMPRWASRLTLVVTEVRVERLADCSDNDAMAEGVVRLNEHEWHVPGVDHPNPDFPRLSRATPREMYAALWDVINGSGAWLSNPWVVATTFDVRQGNIDAAV